jgi:uncharacterized protein
MITTRTTVSTPALQTGPGRIQTLDILRGLALMGIFIVHCVTGFSGYMFTTPEQQAALPLATVNPVVGDVVNFLFTDKSRTLFAFMFGVSFFLQLQSAEGQGLPFRWTFLRRLAVLMLVGMIHAHLLFGGDILRYYAAGGLILLLVYRWPSVWLLVTGLVLAVAVPVVSDEVIKGLGLNIFADFPPIPSIHQGFMSESLLDNLDMNHKSAMWRYHYFFLLFFAVPVTGVFLFGVWMARLGYLQRPDLHRKPLRRLLVGGLSGGLVLQSGCLWVAKLVEQKQLVLNPIPALVVKTLEFSIAPLLVALGYVCGTALLCLTPLWLRRLSVLAPAGRMTLTNYVMQSVLGWAVFYGSGFGLYLRVGPALSLLIALALCALQLVYSAWWLRRFRMGPLEWAWRWAVNGRRPAIKHDPAPVAAGSVAG